jgi:secreted PhoX family phosphatase
LTRYADIVPGKLEHGDTYYGGYGDRGDVSPLACPDNVGFDPSGRLWIVSDSDLKSTGNDGCFVVPTHGAERGRLKQIVSAPVGAEVTGCEFTPDGRALFLQVSNIRVKAGRWISRSATGRMATAYRPARRWW